MPCRKLPCRPAPSWKAAEAARRQLTCSHVLMGMPVPLFEVEVLLMMQSIGHD